MKTAIIDDSEKDRTRVKELILQYGKASCISIECDLYANGTDFLQAAKQKAYDIAFIDIYMDSLDGIKTAELFRETNLKCLLVFLTSSTEHRAEAFGVHAFDYLEKPLREDMLKRVLGDAFCLMMQKQPYIDVSVGKITVSMLYSDILYVVSDSNYLVICADEKYRCRMSFSSLSSVLSKDSRFLIINRGILVNLDYVLSMEDLTCTMTNGSFFPLNKKKKDALRQAFISRQFAHRTGRVSKGGFQ